MSRWQKPFKQSDPINKVHILGVGFSYPPPAARYLLLIFLLIAHSSLLLAFAQPNTNTRPPNFSAEVFEIARDLRCPVCQGESAGESNATVAVEMRRIIAEQLAQGKSREEIDAFFVQRYGDWILSRPPTSGINILPWLSPFLGFGLLAFGLWRYQRVAKARAVSTNSDV